MTPNIKNIGIRDPIEVPEDLVGRDDPWNLLSSWPKHHTPAILYLWGPAGIGKTFLMRHVFQYVSERGDPVLWSAGDEAGQSELAWTQHVGRLLELGLDENPSMNALVGLLTAQCAAAPLLWIVDDFDQVKINREWLMSTFLELVGHGAMVVLVGRTSPLQLWPAQSYTRGCIQVIELGDLDSDAARSLLVSRGLTDPTVLTRTIEMSHGRPQLLSAISDGLSLLEETALPTSQWAFMANPVDTAGYLIEQICHPGSRRLMWRAGHPTDRIDTIIAAASVTPMFNRDWLARVAGRTLVNDLWDEFIALPFVHPYRGGYYDLFPRLREEIAETVQKVRPWMWEHWTRTAAEHYLGRVQAGVTPRQHAWGPLSRFVRPHLGEAVFNVDDGELLVECQLPSPNIEGFVRLAEPRGTHMASAVLRSPAPRRLLVEGTWWDAGNPQALAHLVSHVADQFHLYDDVEWTVQSRETSLDSLLEILQFQRVSDTQWHLKLGQSKFLEWLEVLVSPPAGHPPRDPVAVVQSVLRALREGIEDYDGEVTTYWNSVSTTRVSFRAWFLDALNSADLGDRAGGKTVVVLYYLDRRGTHEELAEMLHVSRATYFRNHRDALERLAKAVFD